MNKVSLAAFLVAGAFAVYAILSMLDEVPAAAGFVGGILTFIALLQLLKDAPQRHRAHKGLVIAALVLAFVGGFLFRAFLRQSEPTTVEEARTYLIMAFANDTVVTLVPFLAFLLLANIVERSLLGLGVVLTAASGVMILAAFDSTTLTQVEYDAALDLWLNVANFGGNLPVVAACALLGVRWMKADPAGASVAGNTPATPHGPPSALTCPRCRGQVARPATGDPRCATCGFPGPDVRAATR